MFIRFFWDVLDWGFVRLLCFNRSRLLVFFKGRFIWFLGVIRIVFLLCFLIWLNCGEVILWLFWGSFFSFNEYGDGFGLEFDLKNLVIFLSDWFLVFGVKMYINIVERKVMMEKRKKVFVIVMVFVMERKVRVIVVFVRWFIIIFNFMVWVCNCRGKIFEVRIYIMGLNFIEKNVIYE